MSEADKMLHEIGYMKEYEDNSAKFLNYESKFSDKEISFDLINKEIRVEMSVGYSESITMQELQAINKKCEELRLGMTVREFLKDILNKKTRKKKIQIRYGSGYYTFYVEDFEFIKDTNGTGLIIGKILDEEIEVLK